jgi:hypothetical protein
MSGLVGWREYQWLVNRLAVTGEWPDECHSWGAIASKLSRWRQRNTRALAMANSECTVASGRECTPIEQAKSGEFAWRDEQAPTRESSAKAVPESLVFEWLVDSLTKRVKECRACSISLACISTDLATDVMVCPIERAEYGGETFHQSR